MPTSTVEDYLKQLYIEQSGTTELVAMGKLASAMGVVPGTATVMIKTLAEAGLVHYESRSGARLTDGGEKLALSVLRRHRLVELFLVKVLGLDWSEVHAEAEELEHAISDKVLERIDALLDHPTVDPHGDPIPTVLGTVADARLHTLSLLEAGESATIARVTDQAPAFLQFVDRCGLTPGASITINQRDESADAITVTPENRKKTTIGLSAAEKILVRKTP